MKKTRNYIYVAIGIVVFVAGLCLMKKADSPQAFMRALPFICIGAGSGLLGYGFSNILTNKIYQNNPDMKKQMDINHHDERNITIVNRAKAKAYDVMIFVFSILILVFALIGMEALPVLLLVLAYLFVQGIAVYYRCKYEKEM